MPVTHVLHLRYLKAPKDGLIDPRGSLANEVPSHARLQSKPINVSTLSQMRWCPYTLVMVVTTNTTIFQRTSNSQTRLTTSHGIVGKFGRAKVW